MSKALLMILDGWGIGNKSQADAISCTPTPHWDALLEKYPHSQQCVPVWGWSARDSVGL